MDEPVLNFNFTLEDAAARGGWHEANRYAVWVGRQALDAPPWELMERRPEGFVRLPAGARSMRLVPAGMPFRVAHLFAPWQVSDADTVYLRVARADGVFHLLVATSGPTVKESAAVWICAGCGAEMARARFAVGTHGLVAFWPFLLVQARAFNAAPERHICAACGEPHPLCYGFAGSDDSADEAAARALW
ncbi:MAG TPA: hypothetical protein VN802_10075 [Stellaceae bacterium]|nr:hypothetical protein [Stellaceae bacterium]